MTLLTRRRTLLAVVGAATAAGGAQLLPTPAAGRERSGWPPAAGRLRFAVPVPTPFGATLELDLAAHRQLLDFYRRCGAAAVLAVSATGEMLSISWPEALQLNRQAAAMFGRQRTWASVSRGSDLGGCLTGIAELRAAGVGVPVVVPGLLAGARLSEDEALQRLLAVGGAAGGPLGLYEAVAPYHRTLSPQALATLTQTGNYRLLKTTQGSASAVRTLLQAAGPELQLYQANTSDLAAVLADGAAGVLNFSAAAFPELLGALLQRWGDRSQAETLDRLCRWIAASDAAFQSALAFPRGIKAALALRGLAISPRSRQAVADLSADQQAGVVDVVQQFRGWCRDLNVRPLI